MPVISVIVPVFNVQDYLEQCIESILNQTFSDFELILIDDGSTDDSGKICEEYRKTDERVVFVKTDHCGAGGARNAGLEAARGSYISFVDGDDFVHPRYLEILYQTLQTSQSDIAVVAYEERREACLSDFTESEAVDTSFVVLSANELMSNLFRSSLLFMAVWGKLYKREIIGANRFNHYWTAEDVEFNSRVYPNAVHTAYINAPLYFWFVRGDSITHSKFSQNNIDGVEAYWQAYNNVRKFNPRYGGYALMRLYKGVLAQKYNTTSEYAGQVREVNRAIIKATRTDFLLNRYVSLGFKVSIMSFMYLPFTYNIYRYIMEQRHKRH